MSEDPRSIVGDRRRNPFPSMTEAEYQLFLATIREQVTAGVTAAMASYRKDNCEDHVERTEHIETAVFGRRELGVVGMDETLARHDRQLDELLQSITFFQRLIYGTLATALVGLLIGLVQFAIIGK